MHRGAWVFALPRLVCLLETMALRYSISGSLARLADIASTLGAMDAGNTGDPG